MDTSERDRGGWTGWVDQAQIAGLASVGAGAIHLAAAGMHAEHPTVARIFVLLGALQVVAGLVLALGARREAAAAVVVGSLAAVGGWVLTRTTGISWVAGLEDAEAPQVADTACAGLGAIAAALGYVVLWRGARPAPRLTLVVPGTLIGLVSVAGMLTGATHVHRHGADGEAAPHDHGTATPGGSAVAAHAHGAGTAHDHAASDALAWPRPWDPTAPIDFSGVPGVSTDQQARAEGLVAGTLADLPQFADVSTIEALGFRSIGDASSGYEHYLNGEFLGDEAFLDPNRPESVVYQVDGERRTLVSAMYIATDMGLDDPQLVDYGGPLMHWHVHDNLCWELDDGGRAVVAGVTGEDGTCAPGTVKAGERSPMVHVWIAPHECGPFAALEGHGAGQTTSDGTRTDQCAHEHAAATPAPDAFDPTAPVELSGTAGVTPQQETFAEDLVTRTLADLPQWADPEVAEAAGFHSIGDGATGHEHYVQWDWIDDGVVLDPNRPESLVYVARPDGSKQLVSAMYMLPTTVALEDVPDWGGSLMQWHVHDDLCYSDDPVAPQVRGLTMADGTCRAPLVKHDEAPMIHVWITPHECGPFAALEGVAAGSVVEGEEHRCDHVHGG